jgi:mono/diheme cytochrome c family protein
LEFWERSHRPALLSVNPEAEVHIQRVGAEMCKNWMSLIGWRSFLTSVGVVWLSAIMAAAQAPQQPSANSSVNQGKVARGQYIVNGVAMCGMCHTPRNDAGEIDRGRWLDGAALWLLPAHPDADWPLKAPRIAGSPPASDEEMVRLLTTGIWKTGTYLRTPMPQFRMSKEDAEAVVTYLRSLTPHAGD